jgi:hypothetical protein
MDTSAKIVGPRTQDTGADLGTPRLEGVDGEGAGPQAHPPKAAGDGGVLDLTESVEPHQVLAPSGLA